MEKTPQIQLPAPLSALAAANRLFAERVRSGDVAAAARGVYTAGARALPPGAPMIRGRDAIVSFWKEAASALGLTDVILTTVEVEGQGSGVLEIGRAELAVGGGQDRVTGK